LTVGRRPLACPAAACDAYLRPSVGGTEVTKELKLTEQMPGSVLASELKRIDEVGIGTYLRSLENQALSISSVVSSQLAETDFAFADAGRLYSERMEGMAAGLRNTLQLAESSIAHAASAFSLAHSDSIAQAVRMWDTSSAAQALQISKAFEQVGRTLGLTPAHEQMRRSLDYSKAFEQMGKSLDYSKAFEQMGKSLDFTKEFERVTGTIDFTKHAEVAARSIIDGLHIQAGAATLDLRSMFDEVRASSAMSMLVTGQTGSGAAALDLSAVREVVEEVVQRYVPKPGERSAPADYPWDAAMKQLGWYALIVLIIVWLFTMTVDAYWHVKVERFMNAHDPKARAEIVTEAREDFGREYADGLRCTKTNLNVRQDPSPEAAIVGHLMAGQPVEVVEAQGPFSRIRYRVPGSDQLREGWAASGYLVKFVPPGALRKDKK
jgi:hypothetical protein